MAFCQEKKKTYNNWVLKSYLLGKQWFKCDLILNVCACVSKYIFVKQSLVAQIRRQNIYNIPHVKKRSAVLAANVAEINIFTAKLLISCLLIVIYYIVSSRCPGHRSGAMCWSGPSIWETWICLSLSFTSTRTLPSYIITEKNA